MTAIEREIVGFKVHAKWGPGAQRWKLWSRFDAHEQDAAIRSSERAIANGAITSRVVRVIHETI